jgi:hypothetical protein
MHPVINQIGVDTQNGVIKEEKVLAMIIVLMAKVINVVKTCSQTILIDGLLLTPWNILTLPLWKISRHSTKNSISNNAVLVVAGDLKSCYQRMD